MWARIYLIPALQAEEDRDQVRRYLADKAREKELLGTETRVYHSDRHASAAPLRHPASLTEPQIRTADVRCDTRKAAEVGHEMGGFATAGTGLYIYNSVTNVSVEEGALQCATPGNAYPFFASNPCSHSLRVRPIRLYRMWFTENKITAPCITRNGAEA
jgi:hypothetical protein